MRVLATYEQRHTTRKQCNCRINFGGSWRWYCARQPADQAQENFVTRMPGSREFLCAHFEMTWRRATERARPAEASESGSFRGSANRGTARRSCPGAFANVDSGYILK